MTRQDKQPMVTPSSPHIDSLGWGRVSVEGRRHFKDVKLFPGGAREWDWNETGTHHSPGIQLAEVEELLDHGAMVVVLSRGQLGQLGVPRKTLKGLEDRGVEVHVHRTRKAVEVYNRLRVDRPVGALIHSTC